MLANGTAFADVPGTALGEALGAAKPEAELGAAVGKSGTVQRMAGGPVGRTAGGELKEAAGGTWGVAGVRRQTARQSRW